MLMLPVTTMGDLMHVLAMQVSKVKVFNALTRMNVLLVKTIVPRIPHVITLRVHLR